MRNDIISIVCLLIAGVLYLCAFAAHSFNWIAVFVGFELIAVTVAVIPVIIERCKK